jgi:class 3 adenylate cyclase
MLLLVLALFSFTSLVNATITLEKAPYGEYILGEEIDIDVFVDFDNSSIVFVNSKINCPSRSLSYFRTPVNFENEAGFVDIPPLLIDSNFLGSCEIKISVSDLDENILGEFVTSSFNVTSYLILEFNVDKEQYLPGENILIEGKVESGSGVDLELSLLDSGDEIETFDETLSDNFFSVVFKLGDNVFKGEREILVKITDEFGNEAEDSKFFEVLSVARRMKLNLTSKEIMPYENLSFFSNVYDQADESMDASISYRIFDAEGEIIESFMAASGERVLFNFSKDTKPADYLIKALYKDFEDIDKFSVLEYREINVQVEDGLINVLNTGNVRYIDDLVINASNQGVIYQVPISLDLSLNEEVSIDLTIELPSDSYDLMIASENESFVLSSINVQDNRPVVKKMSQGLSRITGNAIIQTEEVGNIFYFGFFMILVGFIVIFMIQRRFKKKIWGVVDDTVNVQKKKIGGLKESVVRHKKEKSKLQKMFGSYVDKDLLKRGVDEGIKKREISILFTDIRGFSKLCERKDSGEIADILNRYFSKSSEIAKKNRGFINKFIGDSVMALFNSIRDDSEHLVHSIKSGLEIKNEMTLLNKKLKEKGLEPIEVGIGVDSGICSVGNLGSKEKLEFTAIGNPVNIAFRLQSLSEGNILITERVYEKVKDKVNARFYGEYEMKNISGKVKVYEVGGMKY